MKIHKPALALTALATSLVSVTAAAAPIQVGTVIGIDFGPTNSTNNFNDANSTAGSIAAGALKDTSNVTVNGVGFSWTSGASTLVNNNSETDSEIGGDPFPTAFNDSNTTDWLLAQSSNTITLTFTGLLNGAATYDLLIGAANTNANPSTTWTADGQSITTDSDAGGVSSTGGTSFVTLTGLKTDGAGNLVITGNGAAPRADISAVSALTLTATAVPEPGSLALMGLGGLCLIKRRRRD